MSSVVNVGLAKSLQVSQLRSPIRMPPIGVAITRASDWITTVFTTAVHQAGECDSRKLLVRKKGLEPSRPCGRQPLKLVRLPIPPLPQSRESRASLPADAGRVLLR